MSLPHHAARLSRKSPMGHRCFAAMIMLLTLLLVPMTARAQAEVSVEDAVRVALANQHLVTHLDAQIASARAQLAEITVIPTPALGVTHEQVFGDTQVGYLETSAMVEQRFDLSAWRGALREALPHQEEALRAELAQRQLEVATSAREAFFRVRHHDERLAALDAWIAHLERGLEGLRAREARGDASAYQTRRIARELELAQARRITEALTRAEAWAELQRWTAWQPSQRLVGELAPAQPVDEAANAGPLRPELARLQSTQRALDAELGAWGSPIWRGWSVGAGYRYAEVGQSVGHGLLITLSVPLALWNTDAPRQDRLRSQQVEVRHELTLRQGLITREVSAARERHAAALRALDALPDPAQDAELSRMAQAAFDADEASLVELLDAFESDTDLQLARLDVQWEARRAAIALDHSLGIGARP